MDSKTRCEGYKYEKRFDYIVSHKSYSGDLPIEVIVSDIKYIKSKIDKHDENAIGFGKFLDEVINKLKDDKYVCNYHEFDIKLIEKELIYIFLPILIYIIRKISNHYYLRIFKHSFESDLNVRVHFPFVE